MLNKVTEKPNVPIQWVHDAYNHNIRKIICITAGLTILLCKISLQFCCKFINNNRPNIFFIQNVVRIIKFPTSILYIAYSAIELHKLIKEHRDPKGKKELAKIVGNSASLINSTIEVLKMLKVIHFLAGNNGNIVNHISLTSTVLLLFISEPISYYCTYKKYQDAYKKHQDKNSVDEFDKCEKELVKRKKKLAISTLTLSLGLLNFIFKRIETTTVPINLGNGIIYNFNLSTTVSIMYSAVFLAVQFEKLFNQPINGDPYSELDNCNIDNSLPDNSVTET